MATSIAVYANGSAANLNGSAISLDGTETARFPIPALNTAYTMMYRTVDASGNDPGENTDSSFTVTVPASFEVSATASAGAWATTAVLPVATGANKPLYIRQTAGVADGDYDIEVGTGGVTFTAGTRLSAPTLSAAAGDAAVTLTIGALTGESGFQVQRATNSGFTTGLVTLTSSLAADSTSYVNNSANGNAPSNGTLYYYRVRGFDANGAGTWSDTASATLTAWNPIFSDNFEDNNLTGWTAELGWAAASGGLNSTSYAARAAGSGAYLLWRAFGSTYSNVRVQWRAKTGATIGTNIRHGTYVLWSLDQSPTGNSAVAQVSLKDGYLQVVHSGTWTNVVSISADTEYLLSITFDANDNDLYTVSVNGSTYDNGGSKYRHTAGSSFSGCGMFSANRLSTIGTEYCYLDEVVVEYR